MTTYRGNATLGARVLSAEGEELGEVGRIAGTCFRVEAPDKPDYWLGADTIAKVSGAGVRVNLPKDFFVHPRFDPQAHHGYHHHN
jgi:hypothetical protein